MNAFVERWVKGSEMKQGSNGSLSGQGARYKHGVFIFLRYDRRWCTEALLFIFHTGRWNIWEDKKPTTTVG